ncbi:MAG: D-lysine 5,6-aminomutase subunit alpha [Deltaproteobacteria bacterium HGW-Deltaproteobacteria-17]|nr:MAG: D-lysine 5,6-aminomutase subunit alpha [Deltaproteobacteria bacterium HGW-Deltaproteobacteria-17]
MSLLGIDQSQVQRLRGTADEITRQIAPLLKAHTTVTVERAVLRMLGLDGVDHHLVPLPNVVVNHLREKVRDGAATAVLAAMLHTHASITEVAEQVARGELDLHRLPSVPMDEIQHLGLELATEGLERIQAMVRERNSRMDRLPVRDQPWKYVIVATGNIYEDVAQAKAAVRRGADIIAVIRTTGQSLLDYVPYGPTTEGFGGTYATQANFRIMRAALDEVAEETGHYVRLVNYASGLCMPEIVVMGAFERLDMMLNDSMYGILFRDINPIRTFVDQFFSRMVDAAAEIIINTGEDNYLTTADAVEAAHTVLASDFINESFGLAAGLRPGLLGLGHAFEIDPELEDSFLLELSQALLLREVFPDSPLKYMPPTKHMSGDIFKGYLMNAMFNLAGIWSQQGIQLLGMLTEAMHTPFLQDRFLALQNADYIMNAARHIKDQVTFRPDSLVIRRAHEVMDKTDALLDSVRQTGLLQAISSGWFADISRPADHGKGLLGVHEKSDGYFNPCKPVLAARLGLEKEIDTWI